MAEETVWEALWELWRAPKGALTGAEEIRWPSLNRAYPEPARDQLDPSVSGASRCK
jgi:hypothetical protein